jgi:hypothetical protein
MDKIKKYWKLLTALLSVIILFTTAVINVDSVNKIFGNSDEEKQQTSFTEQSFNDNSTHINGDQINYYGSEENSDSNESVHYGTIQLLELIKMFSIPQGASYNVQDWRVGAKSPSPITWITEGLDWVDEGDNKVFCNYSDYPAFRVGKVYIQLGENYTHYKLNESMEPVVWEIYLFGARCGIFEIALVNNVCTERIKFQKYFKERNCLRSKIETGVHPMAIEYGEELFGLFSETYDIVVDGVNITINELIDKSGNCGSQVEIHFSPTGNNVLNDIIEEKKTAHNQVAG